MEDSQYYRQISKDGQLTMPDNLTKRLGPRKSLRVMIFLEDEAPEWKNAVTGKFFD